MLGFFVGVVVGSAITLIFTIFALKHTLHQVTVILAGITEWFEDCLDVLEIIRKVISNQLPKGERNKDGQ